MKSRGIQNLPTYVMYLAACVFVFVFLYNKYKENYLIVSQLGKIVLRKCYIVVFPSLFYRFIHL